jgi:hypothetical protein
MGSGVPYKWSQKNKSGTVEKRNGDFRIHLRFQFARRSIPALNGTPGRRREPDMEAPSGY